MRPQDVVDDRQRDDREHGAEVEAADLREQASEQAQERLAHVAQEREHGVNRPRVRAFRRDRYFSDFPVRLIIGPTGSDFGNAKGDPLGKCT